MNLDTVIEYFGSQAKLAESLNVTRSAISQWVTAGEIPTSRQWQIQVLTNGHLKVSENVTNEEKA